MCTLFAVRVYHSRVYSVLFLLAPVATLEYICLSNVHQYFIVSFCIAALFPHVQCTRHGTYITEHLLLTDTRSLLEGVDTTDMWSQYKQDLHLITYRDTFNPFLVAQKLYNPAS